MSIILRTYRVNEFDRACEIREIDSDERRERFRLRFENIGEWYDHYFHLAIEKDGVLVGDFQLRHCDKSMPPGYWEMGLEVAAESRGQGIGTEALIAGSKYAFENGCHRVQGSTEEGNTAMRKAFLKAGWNFEGVQKALFLDNGVPIDYYSYAITKFDL
jgi:RimJ/RimL family protein N-acetyltransferase